MRLKKDTPMPSPLVVVGEDPVTLVGLIDGGGTFHVAYGTTRLSGHDDTLHAHHSNLDTPSGTMQIRLTDFSHGGAYWQLTASHIVGTSWSRTAEYAHCSFTAMTDAVEVDVTATSNDTTPQTKTRKVWIKTMPQDGLPDRP